eukprot:TRINITY_DN14438_c0_g2_i1.p5 TRINITY_DN14438_c0_g2~~TRINITY_DN14438_c0_g2_i1.p5  ORF type:complete len:179 (-),score=79.46 TRINITY_DN14438_c0_g2_i1:1246-1782(-)
MLDAVLSRAEVLELEPKNRPALPEDAFCGGRLLLWNLWGFSGEQRAAWAALAGREEVGLVLADLELAPDGEDLAHSSGALAFISASYGVSLSRLALHLAANRQERICRLLAKEADLRQQLADRDVIEKAKSILIAALGISEPEAMIRLQQQARRSNQKLARVAAKVIAANQVFNGDDD